MGGICAVDTGTPEQLLLSMLGNANNPVKSIETTLSIGTIISLRRQESDERFGLAIYSNGHIVL